MIKTEIHRATCPYTGLRSFTEEESLYFKGRDLQIGQITSLLEENKFLMVTGASGEGKSSVIYAGLIPNARAGFFRAKYTNWIVADFRPERNPLQSMAKSLADKFDIPASTVDTELKHGFSALADLYTNSDFFTDENDARWKTLDDQEKRNKRRKAANLLILVDQFEEFFTNPENFHNESPSQDSQIVVNLILETARIAMKRGLPIYIVCTMRSDYIGQCSAFRGLAEYIGFSQFFVPRLKRKDLKQVIEEPAILNGNRISQRLIERLVFDLADGIDQLPILQHALSQIWLMADNGAEEMDLLHYAKVGGMPPDELPDGDRDIFMSWFLGLEEYKRALYQETGLHKVIEIHANILYESAHNMYGNHYPDRLITERDAKRIIAMTFACLTKIDNSRAVRSRMTLLEITGIINDPLLTSAIVGKVLEVFREEGNSFIRPFKTEEPSTHSLTGDAILDITHESLIRSWGRLDHWVNREFEYYTNYLDFKKQLDRWKESGKNSGYLLPIGPLSFFENWYAKCKPNIGWIKRYIEIEDNDLKQRQSTEILADAREFLKRSARKVIVTRAFMKYGSQRIAVILSILIMLGLSGFYWYDALQKQNSRVVESVKNEAHALLGSEYVDDFAKGIYLMTEERYAKGSLMKYLKSQTDQEQSIYLANNSNLILTVFDKKFHDPVKQELISHVHDALEKMDTKTHQKFLLEQRVQFVLELAYDNYYNPTEFNGRELRYQSSALYPLITMFFSDPRLYDAPTSAKLNQAIQLWLTFGDSRPKDIQSLIQTISPRSSDNTSNLFNTFYVPGSFEPNGIRPLDFNGGYHMLASLYAAEGMTEQVIQCFGKLLPQSDYWTDRVFNNFTNVIGYLYQFNHRDKVTTLSEWITKNTSRSPESIYNELVNRSGCISHLYRVNFDFGGFTEEGSFQLNLCLADRKQTDQISEDYEKLVKETTINAERNFLLAVHYKRMGIFGFKYSYDRGLPIDKNVFYGLFSKSMQHFSSIDEDFLNGEIAVSYPLLFGTRTKEWTRRNFYIYPDYIGGLMNLTYHADIFFNYLRETGGLDKLYKSASDLNFVHYWLTNAFEVRPFYWFEAFSNRYPLSDSLLLNVLSYATQHFKDDQFDKNLIHLVLSNRYFERGDASAGMQHYKKINFENAGQWTNKYEEINKSFLLNQVRYLCSYLAETGEHDESIRLIEKFENTDEKIMAYLDCANRTYDGQQFASSFEMLDSAYTKAKLVNFTQIPFNRDFRDRLIFTSSKFGGKKLTSRGYQFLRDIPEGRKFGGIFNMVDGSASSGNFYKALANLPTTLTENQDLDIKTLILWKAALLKGENKDYENILDKNFNWDYIFYGNFSLN